MFGLKNLKFRAKITFNCLLSGLFMFNISKIEKIKTGANFCNDFVTSRCKNQYEICSKQKFDIIFLIQSKTLLRYFTYNGKKTAFYFCYFYYLQAATELPI